MVHGSTCPESSNKEDATRVLQGLESTHGKCYYWGPEECCSGQWCYLSASMRLLLPTLVAATHYTLFYSILTTICRAWRQVQDCSSTPMETHWMQSLHRLLHNKLLYSLLQFTSLHISTVLYCTAVYCTVLHCTALCVPLLWICLVQWPVLHCSVLHSTELCCTGVHPTVLFSNVFYCTLPWDPLLQHRALHYTTLYLSVLLMQSQPIFFNTLSFCCQSSTMWCTEWLNDYWTLKQQSYL